MNFKKVLLISFFVLFAIIYCTRILTNKTPISSNNSSNLFSNIKRNIPKYDTQSAVIKTKDEKDFNKKVQETIKQLREEEKKIENKDKIVEKKNDDEIDKEEEEEEEEIEIDIKKSERKLYNKKIKNRQPIHKKSDKEIIESNDLQQNQENINKDNKDILKDEGQAQEQINDNEESLQENINDEIEVVNVEKEAIIDVTKKEDKKDNEGKSTQESKKIKEEEITQENINKQEIVNDEIEFFNNDNKEAKDINIEEKDNSWWLNNNQNKEKQAQKIDLKTRQNQERRKWWEIQEGMENILLVNGSKENSTSNSNWWEAPKAIKTQEVKKEQERNLPWYLNQEELNENQVDKFFEEQDKLLYLANLGDTTEFDTTLFDVYLGGQNIGLVLVNYTDRWFEIPEPQELLDLLTEVKNTSKIRPLLEGKILNQKSIPKVGDIAIDTNRFMIILDIDKDNLTETQLAINKLIGDPIKKFSLENRSAFSTSGNIDDSNSTSSFSHRTLLSYGKHFIQGEGYIDDDEDYELKELNFGTIVDQYSVKGGYIQNKGTNYSPSMEILGVKIETEEELFVDSDLTHGSKIEIFVPSTAKVLFYRNNTLIDYQVLNYGLQEVNTARFPQGSYEVDIEIREYNGKVTRDRQFFTKSGFLASRDRPVYYASLGSGRKKFDTIDVPVIEGGTRWRASDKYETEVSVFGTESIAIASSAIRGLWKDFYYDLGAGISDEGDFAYNATLSTNFKNTFFSITWNEVRGDDSHDLKDNASKKDEYLFLAESIKNKRRMVSANIQQSYDKFSYGVKGSWNLDRSKEYSPSNNNSQDYDYYYTNSDSYTYGPWARYNIISDSKQTLNLDANYYIRKKEDNNFYTSLNYSRRLNDKVQNNTSLSYNKDNRYNARLKNKLYYDDFNMSTNQGLAASLEEEGTKYQGNDEAINSNLNIQYGNPYLYNASNLYNNNQGSYNNTSYATTIQASMILTQDGFGKILTPQRSSSMIIVNVVDKSRKKKEKANNEYNVIINGMKYSKVKAGVAQAVSLSPYKTYNVKIEPTEESDLTIYDEKEKTVTLFPGNIAPLNWEIQSMYIGIGRILNKDNQPISYQQVKGTNDYSYTEQDGYFQFELTGKENLFIKSSKYDCKITLPTKEIDDVIVDYGDLICK